MSTVIPVGPPLQGLLAEQQFARGDSIPDAAGTRILAQRINTMLGRRLKVLWRKFMPLESSTLFSASGSNTIWRGQFHTSKNIRQVKAKIITMGSANVGTDHFYRFSVDGFAQKPRRVLVDTTSLKPNNLRFGEQVFLQSGGAQLDGDTDYEFSLEVNDGCRVIGVIIYEVTRATVDTADATLLSCPLDPLTVGGPILARELAAMTNNAWKVWQAQGPSHVCWSVNSNTGISQTGTTYENLMDLSTTGYASGAAGQWFYGADHGRYSSATVPCTFWCYASTNAGSNGRVRFTDSGGTMATITGIGTTPQMYTTTASVTARDSLVVVEHSNANAGQTTTTYAAGFYELGT